MSANQPELPAALLSAFGRADSVITISQQAVVANWRYLASLSSPTTETAAVVKADAYGLGASQLAPHLVDAGCRTFFVMSLDEAITLRGALNDSGHDANGHDTSRHDTSGHDKHAVLILGGCHRGQEDEMLAHDITPVINTSEQAERLGKVARERGMTIPVALHIDTGMSRLGLDTQETARLAKQVTEKSPILDGLSPRWLMSHLRAGEDDADPANEAQLHAFTTLRTAFPGIAGSLANSGGTLRGPDFHFDMTRPGIALYGLHPAGMGMRGQQAEQAGRLIPAIRWDARILQIRTAKAGDAVGYNGTHVLVRNSRIATIGVGYADGYMRALGNRAIVVIAGHEAPVIGRVSMDSITVDVTDIPATTLQTASTATVLGDGYNLARMADDAGTIGYEILTRLGQRPRRLYLPA